MSRQWAELCSVLFFSIVLSLFSIPAAAADPVGPSFNCAHARPLEAVICADPKLSADDRMMARLYAASQRDILDYGPSQQPAEQRQWLKDRESCAPLVHPMPKVWHSLKSANECLTLVYASRLKALAVATLFHNPDLSLAALKDKDPKAAPFYEAIYRYATIENRQKRAAIVGPLIQSAFVNGRALGADSTADAIKSDASFSEFIAMNEVMMDLNLTIPCTALQRRPGLIQLLYPRYASSMDGRLPLSDCETMLPPLPAMDRLIDAAWDALPPCDYTIRFSYYRDFAVQEAATRLHQPEYWRRHEYGPHKRYEKEPPLEKAFRHSRNAEINSVTSQLADYYVRVFNIDPKTAQYDAAFAIDYMLYTQFIPCVDN